ncbi:fmHP [Ophiocordyceps sinensis CO18]|uniref:FmHP n=1 Tax=Ophiocordyceps sinensis (strain Co18 / CGMCC 3.14243) TaxID=911162 RepID=T5AMA6_OPHSC|nr:fmHP [Ophiocordyceps sinensis CO18]
MAEPGLTSAETDGPTGSSAAGPHPRGDDSHAQSVDDASRPTDFEGELPTTNELPSPETINKIDDYIVLDAHGRTHTFQSLYGGRNAARRVLFVFVRHFFCGNCQEYLRSLSESVTPEALLQLPVSTVVVVVGCGNPNLIDMYVKATKCPFPVYTDPNASLYSELGMVKTLAMGPKPEYMRRPMIMSVVESIGQGLRSVPSGLALKSGDHRQVGGEFLFEPVDVVTPVVTPLDETPDPMGPRYGGRGDDDSGPIEPKRGTWGLVSPHEVDARPRRDTRGHGRSGPEEPGPGLVPPRKGQDALGQGGAGAQGLGGQPGLADERAERGNQPESLLMAGE